MAKRSTSALQKRVQIIRTDSGCNLHSPWGIPFLESMSALRFRRPGCALLRWREKYGSPIAGNLMPVRREVWSKCLLGDLYRKQQTCSRCESVHSAVPAAAENPLELRTLLPAPSGLCATGSAVLTTAPKLACPRTLLPSRESMRQSSP